MSSKETRERGGQATCSNCHQYRTGRIEGICYRCEQEINKDNLLKRFAVKYPIPFPESLKGVPLPCEGHTALFETDEAQQDARDMCEWCPAREWCLDFGMWNDQWGTWGGLSQHERRVVKKGLRKSSFHLIA